MSLTSPSHFSHITLTFWSRLSFSKKCEGKSKRIRSDALHAFQIICTFAYSFINMQLYELQCSKYPL